MSKDADSPFVVSRNEDVEAASLFSLHGDNNEYSEGNKYIYKYIF